VSDCCLEPSELVASYTIYGVNKLHFDDDDDVYFFCTRPTNEFHRACWL